MSNKIDFDLLMETAKKYGKEYVDFVLTVNLYQEFNQAKNHESLSKENIIDKFNLLPHVNHYVKPFELGGFGVNRQGETFKIIKIYKPRDNECLYENEDGELFTSNHSRVSHYLIKFLDGNDYITIITEKQLSEIYIDMIILCEEMELKYFYQISKNMNDKQLSGFCESDNPYHKLTDKGHFLGYDKIHGIPKKTGYNRKYYIRFIKQEQILDFSQYLLSLNSHNIIHTTWHSKHIILGDENNE